MAKSFFKTHYEKFVPDPAEDVALDIDDKRAKNSQFFLIQVPKDFDPKVLNDLQFDLDSNEIQNFDAEEENQQLSIKRLEGDGDSYIGNQTMILFPKRKKSTWRYPRKKADGCIKVSKNYVFGKVSKRAIVKTKPVTLKGK